MFGFNLRLGHPARQAPARAFNALTTALFRNGEQGFAYDHNDFSTLFQDSAGTIPVTAADQPVGLQLDKSKGLVLGGERATNGDFSAGTAGWTLTPGSVAIADGAMRIQSIDGTNAAIVQNMSLVVGKSYVVTFDLYHVSGVASVQNSAQSTTYATFSTSGRKQAVIFAVDNGLAIKRQAGVADFSVDNISVRELPGNHRFQSAAASRPMLRYNATTGSYYLQYDGTDDFLQTNAINFTATDKVSVFAGVRKLSEVTALLLELSADINANNGAFNVVTGGTLDRYRWFSKGTIPQGVTVTGVQYNAPHSAVLAQISNISTDALQIRVNGAVAAQNTADQGTGNYGNHPMYFGRRGGTMLPFNGHEYSPICVGRLTTAAETANIERLLARQVGVALA